MISEFPLLVFTVAAGLATGLYATNAVFSFKREGARKDWVLPLIALVLLVISLLATLAHLNHPERFINAMFNPLAMITEEAYWSIIIGVIMLVDVLMARFWKNGAPRGLRIAGAVAGLVLMCVTGVAYGTSQGVAAWYGAATVPSFLLGDLALGFGLYGALKADSYKNSAFSTTSLVIMVLAAIAYAALAAQMSAAAADIMLVIVGVVLTIVAAALILVVRKAENPSAGLVWAVMVCVTVGIFLARYGFYAACTF